MPGHEYFEELCGLAAIGEISAAQRAEINAHLAVCTACQQTFAQFSAIAVESCTAANDRHVSTVHLDSVRARRMRESTLVAVSAHGMHISEEAAQQPSTLVSKFREILLAIRWRVAPHFARIAVVTSMLGLVALSLITWQRSEQWKKQALEMQAHAANIEKQTVNVSLLLHSARLGNQTAAQEALHLMDQLSATSRQVDSLNAQLQSNRQSMRNLQNTIAALSSEKSGLAEKASDYEAKLATARVQLAQVQQASSDKEARLVSLRYQLSGLSEKLNAQQTLIAHEKQLLSEGRDIRDLMAARDLHIIDVHDVDSGGNVRQPFGRIFLTEGKQLIFYAYDLNKAGAKNASFQVWGEHKDDGRAAHSLGIFYVDDKTKSRWVMKVDNPDLLHEIDSVFVTVEPRGGRKRPSGRRLMYAYLKNPINHP